MKLLTKELEARFAEVGRQEDVSDPIVVAKFFHPMSHWTWYATEYDPAERTFFGLVYGFEREWGSFSLTEMEEVNVHGLGVERDLYWQEKPVSQLPEA
jgi:hypothetical protein